MHGSVDVRAAAHAIVGGHPWSWRAVYEKGVRRGVKAMAAAAAAAAAAANTRIDRDSSITIAVHGPWE